MCHAWDIQGPKSAPRAETSPWVLPDGSERASKSSRRTALSHAQLQLDDQGRGAAGECVSKDTEAGGFEGAGLQCTPRLVFQSGWKWCLVFASFLSSLSGPKKQLKPLETANLKGEKKKKSPNPKPKVQGILKGFIFQESGFIFGKAEKQKTADSPCFWSHWTVGAVRPAHILDPAGQIPGCGEPRLRFISAVSH